MKSWWRRWTSLPVGTRDAVLAVLVVALVQGELVAANDVEGSRALQHLAFTAITGTLALRRTRPLAAAAVLGAGFAFQTLLGSAPVASGFVTLGVITFSVATYAATRARAALGLMAVLAGLAVYPFVADDVVIGDEVVNTLIPTTIWLLARVARERLDRAVSAERDRMVQEQEELHRREDALAAERRRIARELHDTVAHGVTLMLLQTELLRDDKDDSGVVDVVQDAGRSCLDDLRRLLVVLREEQATAPPAGTAELPALVDSARASGALVDYVGPESDRRLPPSLDVAVYRIVQEGLTNAIKHAAGSRISVRWDVTASGVEVVVEDDGAGSALATRGTGGYGLLGLQERVLLHGGALDAGRRPEGAGWRLRAALPLDRLALA